MLVDYVPSESFLHRLDVRTKLVWFCSCIVAVFLFDHPVYAAAVLALLLTALLLSGLPSHGVKRVSLMLLPVFVILFLVTVFSHEPEEFKDAFSQTVILFLFPDRVAPLTVGGILLGITICLRIMVMVLASLLLTLTTPVDDLLQASQRMHVPYVVAFIVTTAIRFIPTMEQKATMVLDAQRSRGADLDSGGLIKRIRVFSSVLVPMIIDSIRMSENLAMALLNRGFGSSRRIVFLDEIHMKRRDYIALATNFLLLAIVVVLYFQSFGRL